MISLHVSIPCLKHTAYVIFNNLISENTKIYSYILYSMLYCIVRRVQVECPDIYHCKIPNLNGLKNDIAITYLATVSISCLKHAACVIFNNLIREIRKYTRTVCTSIFSYFCTVYFCIVRRVQIECPNIYHCEILVHGINITSKISSEKYHQHNIARNNITGNNIATK